MEISDLTPEQQERFTNASSPEEVLKLATEEGFELSDSDLEKVSGGAWSSKYIHCDECGRNFSYEKGQNPVKCPNCGALHVVMN